LKHPSKVCEMKRKGSVFLSRRSSWNYLSQLHEAPLFATPWASSCPAAARYRLTPQESISTTASSAVVREPQCGRVWQFLGTHTRSSHVGCLAVAGSLICHTVWSRTGRSSTRGMPIVRAGISVSPRGNCEHGGRLRWRSLLQLELR